MIASFLSYAGSIPALTTNNKRRNEKMRSILTGAKRSKGEFTNKKTGELVKYDNICLYLMDFNQNEVIGFSAQNSEQPDGTFKYQPVKIRTVDFEAISGVKPGIFLKNFEQYAYHRVRVVGEQNDFGQFEVLELSFSEKTCFDMAEDPDAEEATEKQPTELSEADLGF